MKKIIVALFAAFVLIGCETPKKDLPIATVIREVDNGKVYSIARGGSFAVDLPMATDNNFYWSVDGKATQGMTIASESEADGVIRFVVVSEATGTLVVNYQQFTDVGAKTLKTFSIKVEVIK